MISPIRAGRRSAFCEISARRSVPLVPGWHRKNSARLIRSVFLLVLLLVFPLLTVAETPRKILIFTTYDTSRPGFTTFMRAFRSTIRDGISDRVEYLYEFQENARLEDGRYESELVDYLQHKYQPDKLNLIIAFGAPALKFLLKHEEEVFTDIPKTFYFHDDTEETAQKLWPHVTGVWGNVDVANTLRIAMSLQPDAQKIVVISGTSPEDNSLQKQARHQLSEFESKLPITYLSNLTIEELQAVVASLRRNTIVLYLSCLIDQAGSTFSAPEALSLLAQKTNAPIYGISSSYMGAGMVGGSIFDFDRLGHLSGEISLRLLAGEQSTNISPQTAPNVVAFDWKVLRRWNLDERKLPAGSVLFFKDQTFWERYKWYVIAAIGACILEALLIVWLLFLQLQRKKSERELERMSRVNESAHRHLNEVVSNVPGIVWESVLEPGTRAIRTTFISKYVEKMLGYTKEEWLNTSDFGLKITPDEQDKIRASHDSEEVITKNKAGISQYRWRTKDGRLLWVESYLSPIVDEKGETIGLRGVTLDINERKAAEEALKQTEESKRAILRAIPDLMFLLRDDGVFLDFHAKNPADLLVPPESFLGRSIFEVMPAELAERFSAAFTRTKVSDEPQVLDYKLSLNGVDRWFEGRVVRSGDKILSMVRDVTARKEIEEALTRNERQLAGIISSAMDAIITFDESQRIVVFNRAAEKIFGYPAAEAMGQPLELLVPERLRKTLNEQLVALTDGGVTRSMGIASALYGLRSSGEEFPIEASISQLHINSHKLHTVILRDITQRKRAEEEIKASEETFRAIFNAANDAIFVHDLNSGAIIDANEIVCEMYGYSIEEIKSLEVGDLSSNEPPYTTRDSAVMLQKAANGIPQLFEWRARNKSGRLFWVEVNLKRAFIGTKDVLLAVVRDITSRKQVIDELRRSEERFGKAFRANPQPMSLTTTATGLYLDVNESFLNMSGYEREEVIGHTSHELRIWETPEARTAFLQRLIDKGSIVNFETKFRTKSGSLRVLLSSAESLEIEGEECLLVASSDITERVAAQQALRESEARFRNMADTAPVMIWMSDEYQRSTYFNSQWLAFTGRHLQEELGDGWTKGIHESDYAHCVSLFTSAFNHREPFRMEYRLRRSDGSYRWVYESGAPRFSSDGQFLGFIGSCIDITDRKNAEDAVRSAKDELRLIADALPVLVSQVDRNGYYKFNNRAYETWFGGSREHITGRHMRDVLGEEVWHKIEPMLKKAFAGQEVHYDDFLRYKNGSARWVSVHEIPMWNVQGEVESVVSLVSDITESRRVEETLRDLSGRLIKAQEEERSRLARDLHDDLSQRMAILSIELEQLGSQLPVSTNSQLKIQKLLSVSQDIAQDIHRLSYQLHPSKLDHLGLVAAARGFCQELSEIHGIKIKFQTDGFPGSLSKDVTLCLFRIIQESLHNIVKHSGADQATVLLKKSERTLRLMVSDEGCGFDMSSDKMTSGLGFVGMRERLRLVGGKLTISSQPGKGTKIEVSVPLRERAKRRASQTALAVT